jgi:hypothetical protein
MAQMNKQALLEELKMNLLEKGEQLGLDRTFIRPKTLMRSEDGHLVQWNKLMKDGRPIIDTSTGERKVVKRRLLQVPYELAFQMLKDAQHEVTDDELHELLKDMVFNKGFQCCHRVGFSSWQAHHIQVMPSH